MFSSQDKSIPSPSGYVPLTIHDDGERSSSTTLSPEGRSSSTGDEKENSGLLRESSDNDGFSTLVPAKSSSLAFPKLIISLSIALALLSVINVSLLPRTLKHYHAYPFAESEIHSLPQGDFRMGLDRAAKNFPPPEIYHRTWPNKIARVSRKLKSAVYGHGVQVYITVEDSTIMRFPIPESGGKACAISWTPPPEISARKNDLTTKGDITEIEVWSLIAPSVKDKNTPSVDQLDYDNLSYKTIPVRGELLGTLDLNEMPNSTTVEFACPTGVDSIVVEMTCQRVACHVSYMQLDLTPKMGMELVRRIE